MCRGYGHTATLKRRVIAQCPYFLTGLQPVNVSGVLIT